MQENCMPSLAGETPTPARTAIACSPKRAFHVAASSGCAAAARAARRAGRAAATREPELDASRVEAVAAGRHDAHGVPVRELGEADGALRRGARQLGARRGVHQGRRRWRLRGRLLRVGDAGAAVPLPGAGAGATAASSAAATEELAA